MKDRKVIFFMTYFSVLKKKNEDLTTQNEEMRRVLKLILDTHKRLGPDQSAQLRRPEIMGQVEKALNEIRISD